MTKLFSCFFTAVWWYVDLIYASLLASLFNVRKCSACCLSNFSLIKETVGSTLQSEEMLTRSSPFSVIRLMLLLLFGRMWESRD